MDLTYDSGAQESIENSGFELFHYHVVDIHNIHEINIK